MSITIEIDVEDYMDGHEWARLKKKALSEVAGALGQAPIPRSTFTDLLDAREALLRHRPAAALALLERVVEDTLYRGIR
jgi:hypothetical protein